MVVSESVVDVATAPVVDSILEVVLSEIDVVWELEVVVSEIGVVWELEGVLSEIGVVWESGVVVMIAVDTVSTDDDVEKGVVISFDDVVDGDGAVEAMEDDSDPVTLDVNAFVLVSIVETGVVLGGNVAVPVPVSAVGDSLSSAFVEDDIGFVVNVVVVLVTVVGRDVVDVG